MNDKTQGLLTWLDHYVFAALPLSINCEEWARRRNAVRAIIERSAKFEALADAVEKYRGYFSMPLESLPTPQEARAEIFEALDACRAKPKKEV